MRLERFSLTSLPYIVRSLTAAKRFGNGAIMRDRINERIRKELEVEYGMDMNIYF